MNDLPELAANVLTTASILLAGRNSVHTWWTGIAGCLIFAIVFYEARLYADVALQVFFVVTSILGWRWWLKGKDHRPRPVTHAGWQLFAWVVPAGITATIVYGAILYHFTDAYAPFVDSAVLVFSVVAQFLLMQRRIESWLFWLLVNTIAVPLYFSRELHLTAFLYAIYWVNAVVSLFTWRRLTAKPEYAL